jgi:hypothetical protein
VIIIGAGAAGMMAAIKAGRQGRSVLVLEHSKNAGEKIRISGGGRCNFTNLNTSFKNYLSANPKFAISALSQFKPDDFIAMLKHHKIAWHEKAKGALFCDDEAWQIVDMLSFEMDKVGVTLRAKIKVERVDKIPDGFSVSWQDETVSCSSLVIATGGKSIPKMGATGFGYKIAEQFGLRTIETRAALVPLTFDPNILLNEMSVLSGVSQDVKVTCKKISFSDALLFTHRGLSGPAILQISSYWREGEEIRINLAPEIDVFERLRAARQENGKREVSTILAEFLPKKLAQQIGNKFEGRIADVGDKILRKVGERVNTWRVKPVGSEGYRTAEVTLGGVDTRDLNAKTLEAKQVAGLFFIGEVVDMTGWLGGYNFQWAWASGVACGRAV